MYPCFYKNFANTVARQKFYKIFLLCGNTGLTFTMNNWKADGRHQKLMTVMTSSTMCPDEPKDYVIFDKRG